MWYRRITEINEIDSPNPPDPAKRLRPCSNKLSFRQTPFKVVVIGPQEPPELSQKRKQGEDDAGLKQFKRVRLLSKKTRIRQVGSVSTPPLKSSGFFDSNSRDYIRRNSSKHPARHGQPYLQSYIHFLAGSTIFQVRSKDANNDNNSDGSMIPSSRRSSEDMLLTASKLSSTMEAKPGEATHEQDGGRGPNACRVWSPENIFPTAPKLSPVGPSFKSREIVWPSEGFKYASFSNAHDFPNHCSRSLPHYSTPFVWTL